ncbi:MAG: eukaryotic-like serine/threonine-protein kinase [Acidobacteriaceae bacterium]|nr:eukaryotic-like serine/threonine-protein kinase [Acidobacteriaceae bacterium]
MEGRYLHRPDDRPPTRTDGTAALKFPSDSGSPPPVVADTFSSGSLPTLVDLGSDAPTVVEGTAAAGLRIIHPADLNNQTFLRTGAILGRRYEILQLLGEGGMGSVYRARDREVNRVVALKVIRPELSGNPAILDRFKQELVLSHQVTHKNVIRIYDFGDADGVKFITMEFVEGQDLRTLIHKKKKFSPEEAVEISQQICRALEATHSVGVIHRDLKPQNIMRDKSGRILLMDFGLARTIEGDGMTQTGALVGTMEYMSPEQALGKALDERSDLFTVGLIVYELLTGKMPFQAESALASLIKRTQQRAVPISDHDGSIPRPLTNIVNRCLERDPALRYASVTEMLRDLDAWKDKGTAASLSSSPSRPRRPSFPSLSWPVITGVASVLALAALGYVFRGPLLSPLDKKVAAGPVLSLAIVPFQNKSGDQSWDWLGPSLADMLSTDVGQSAHLRAVSSDRVQQVFHDLRIAPNAIIDSATLGRVAEFTNSDTLVWGQYTKLGDQIRIDATLQDRKHNRTVQVKSEAANQKDLSAAVDRLAEMIRQNLALPSDVVKELQAQSFKPTSTSVEALRGYNEGLQFLRQGNNLEAQKRLEAATKADPQFAVAYSRLGEAYSLLGYDAEAERSSRRAVELSQSLPLAQKYFIEASRARVTKDNQKAAAAYENLAKSFPDNLDVQFALGRIYEDTGSLDRARSAYEKLLVRDPKNVDALLHMGWVEIRSNNSQGSLDYLNRALTLAVQLGNDGEKALILDAVGTAYQYMNKRDEALNNLQQALLIKRKLGDKGGIAETLNSMAGVQQDSGKADQARKSYEEAVSLRRRIGDKKGLGHSLIDLGLFNESIGHYDDALALSKEALAPLREVGDRQNESNCLNNIGWIYLDKADYENAMTYFQQALDIRQKIGAPAFIADSLYNIGDTYTRMGQYNQATDDFLKALDLWRKAGDNRGVAFASYGLGKIFQYQGRYGAALNSQQDALKSWHEVNESGLWLPQIQASYGNTLSLVGLGAEAQKNLDEALRTAREIKNQPLVAQILNFEGDRLFYSGDFNAARLLFEQALKVVSQTTDREQTLVTKFNLAKVAVMQGRSREEFPTLQSLAEEADRSGFKHLAVECTLYLGQAMIAGKEYSRAQEVLQRTLANAEKVGLQVSLAKGHYLLAEALRLGGTQSEAPRQYAEACRILDEVGKEAHSENLLKRSDLARMYQESVNRQSPTT